MRKTIEGLFRIVLAITLISVMSVAVFASEADDPTGRCRIAPIESINIIVHNNN